MDCFICDDCLKKLKEVTLFRDTCRKIHEKNHPSSKISYFEIPSENIIIDEEKVQDEDQQTLDESLACTTILDYDVNQRIANTNELKVKRELTRKQNKKGKAKKEATNSTMIYNDANKFTILDATPINNESEHETYAEVEESETKHEMSKSKSRKCWTAAQKLLIIDFAEKKSNREAARHYKLNESTVRNFRKHKEMLKNMKPSRSTNRHGTAYWPDLECSLKAWVDSLLIKPKIHEIQEKAIELSKSFECENFSGSISYIYKFMQRNGINSSSPRPRKIPKVENETSENFIDEEEAMVE